MTPQQFPKSNATMRSGDFCFVSRSDGRVALFIYLFPQRNSRSYFFGALAAEILPAPRLDLVAPRIALTAQALLHIKCFQENDTPIAGNVMDRIDSELLNAMREQSHSFGVGSTTRVWGYRTIVKYANALAA